MTLDFKMNGNVFSHLYTNVLAHYSGQICIVKISASCPMEQSFYMFRVYRLLYIHFEQCKLILSTQCIFFIDKVFKSPFPPT